MKKRFGFSLMEMMVVMLIVTIIAAAAAPMVNKKLLSNVTEDSPWVWTNGNSIAYNLSGNNSQVAAIGSATNRANLRPKLYVNATSLEPHISFGTADVAIANLYASNTRIALTDTDVTGLENAVLLGPGSSAANDSVSVGLSTTTSGANSIAFGQGANAASDNSLSVGIGTNSTGVSSIAIGDVATTNGERAISIGNLSNAADNNSIAIGSPTVLSDDGNLYITTASAANAIAIGGGAQAIEGDAISVGGCSSAAENAIAIGSVSTASKNSIAIGVFGRATASNSIAVGYASNAHGANATAYGYSSNSANDAVAIGSTANALDFSVAVGSGAVVTGNNSVAVGWSTQAASEAVAVGADAQALGVGSIAIGYNSMASANNSIAIGSGVTAAVRNRVEIGTSSHTVSITGTLTATNFTNTSDRRLKNVGEAFKAGLEEIKKLEPYHFTYKKDKGKTPRVGVMAQDLQKIFPQAVIKGDDGFLLIRMEDMFYAAINAIKEIADKIIANDKRIDELTKQNKELVTIIDQLEARLKELEK